MVGIYLSGTGNTKHCIENTMGAFSGDGAGCTARLLKKYGAHILGGLHVKMPDSVCDSKLLTKAVRIEDLPADDEWIQDEEWDKIYKTEVTKNRKV